MNHQVINYWNEYRSSHNQKLPIEVDAFQFGADADQLAELVIAGKKTATCSAHVLYELEGEVVPQAGQYSIVLNSKKMPVAIIRVTSVSLIPMNEVPEEFALAEGEGDYDYWWTVHQQFFSQELKAYGLSYSEDLLLVCERFELVYK
ncbi:ASCH domain-containing protein [Planococcus sp. SE5232]|uniref:ASCH domain-containing protein n=1 Tax=unclassified Planococcus (in: firmicutes) TaxID=2662419 RepID=UPI003D6A9753